MRAPAPRV